MNTIELTKQRGPFGDECSLYSFTPKAGRITIAELMEDALQTKNEWGTVRVVCQDTFKECCGLKIPVKGATYEMEFRHGEEVSNNIPQELQRIEVTNGSAYGGWGRMDYTVNIPAE